MIDRIRTLVRQTNTDLGEEVAQSVDDEPDEPVTDPDLEIAQRLLTQQLRQAEAAFDEHWDDADLEGSVDALRERHSYRTALRYLETAGVPNVPTFHVDTVTLSDCYQQLFEEPATESIGYLIGTSPDSDMRMLTRCLPVTLTEQSAVRAVGDLDASFAMLRDLDRVGIQLGGYAHNHPGSGAVSTAPSTDDLRYQQQLEAEGRKVIGLILTKDGYMRAFSDNIAFNLEIHGNHVRQEEDHVFHLEEEARTASRRLNHT